MLELSDIDVGISKRLQPLRDTLSEAKIPVVCLPKEAHKYSSEEDGRIIIIIPSVSNVPDENSLDTFQDVKYTINIQLNLGKRYQDNENEKNVLEWCVDQILFLLCGYEIPDITSIKQPLLFDSYNLFKPEKGNWEAEMSFSMIRTITNDANYLIPGKDEQIVLLELLMSAKTDFSDSVIIKKFI